MTTGTMTTRTTIPISSNRYRHTAFFTKKALFRAVLYRALLRATICQESCCYPLKPTLNILKYDFRQRPLIRYYYSHPKPEPLPRVFMQIPLLRPSAASYAVPLPNPYRIELVIKRE